MIVTLILCQMEAIEELTRFSKYQYFFQAPDISQGIWKNIMYF